MNEHDHFYKYTLNIHKDMPARTDTHTTLNFDRKGESLCDKML